jgi:hypothetical protein
MFSNIEEVTYLRQYPNIFMEQLQSNTNVVLPITKLLHTFSQQECGWRF